METFGFDHVTARQMLVYGKLSIFVGQFKNNGNGAKRMMRCTIRFSGFKSIHRKIIKVIYLQFIFQLIKKCLKFDVNVANGVAFDDVLPV